MEEDGEIFEVDPDENQQSDFSMSSYDGDNGDSLDIKPPQAQVGPVKEKKEKKRDRHHRHKGESCSHRHNKAERHNRSRSDHRASGGDTGHTREKRKHRDREDRSESGSRKHRDRSTSNNNSSGTTTALATGLEVATGSSRSKGDKERSRSGKRSSKEHRRGRDRSGNSSSSSNIHHHQQQQQQQQQLDDDNNYYMHEDSHNRLAGNNPNLAPASLLGDPPLMHHHNNNSSAAAHYHINPHHSYGGGGGSNNSSSHHHYGSSGGGVGGSSSHHRSSRGGGGHGMMQQIMGQMQLSPREMTEREKRMERMMTAEKQKEQSQRDAESRRLRKEEEKREEHIEYQQQYHHSGSGGRLQQQHPQQQQQHNHHHRSGSYSHKTASSTADAITAAINATTFGGISSQSMADRRSESPPLSGNSPQQHRHKKRKHNKDHKPDEVHIISENEDEPAGTLVSSVSEGDNRKTDQNNKPSRADDNDNKDKGDSDGSDSGSADTSSGSDSDSDSSDSDDDDEGNKKAKDGSPASTPGREGRFDDSPGSSGLSDVSLASADLDRSSSKSPMPLKELLPNYYPAIMGCRSVDEFECLNRIAEGTYGVVYRAREKCNNTIVALKRLKMEKEKEGFPITSLREINTLLKGQHINIVTVREIVVGCNMDKIYIVMDYVEHDLKALMETMSKKKQSFSLGEVKTLMIQLLRAVHHLHDNWILHRDLKTSNLLLSHTGILKVGDFGLAREYGSPLKQYTPIVVTLWYRAPELLLGTKYYSTAIDVWSVGCIFGELLAMEPLFPGKSEIDELNRVFKELGTPSDAIWPGYSQLPVVKRTQFTEFPYNHLRERFKERLSDKGFLLMNKFLTYDPLKRISAAEALGHDYFHMEAPHPVPSAMFPTWPAKSENPNGISASSVADEQNKPPKPPSGGKNFKDLGDDDHGVPGFFLGGGQQAGAGFQLKF